MRLVELSKLGRRRAPRTTSLKSSRSKGRSPWKHSTGKLKLRRLRVPRGQTTDSRSYCTRRTLKKYQVDCDEMRCAVSPPASRGGFEADLERALGWNSMLSAPVAEHLKKGSTRPRQISGIA